MSLSTSPELVPADRHLPLSVPVFQILLSLAEGEWHGYAIIRDIRERTGGEVRLTASTLYAAVKRLLHAGIIREVPAPPNRGTEDARRRYYRLTEYGREVARLEAARLERCAEMARAKRLLSDLAGES